MNISGQEGPPTKDANMSNRELEIIAIVPMKRLSGGKSRLARTLTPEKRANISIGMLRRVLMALSGASIDPIWVVGGDDRVRNMARNQGALWFEGNGPQSERYHWKGDRSGLHQGKVCALYRR